MIMMHVFFLFFGLTVSYLHFKWLRYVVETKQDTINGILSARLTNAYIDLLVVFILYFNFVYFSTSIITYEAYQLFISYLLGKYAYLATRNFKTDLMGE
jgi:hypothetical protein